MQTTLITLPNGLLEQEARNLQSQLLINLKIPSILGTNGLRFTLELAIPAIEAEKLENLVYIGIFIGQQIALERMATNDQINTK